MTMQDRGTFLGVAVASLLPPLLPTGSEAQTPAPRSPAELARHALAGPFEGFEMVLVELNIPRAARVQVRGTVIRAPCSATSWKGRCALPSTMRRRRSCPRAAPSSSRPAPSTRRMVPRGPMGRRERWCSWWSPRAALSAPA